MKADYQILIVDDDESIRRMLAAVLAREGFQTAMAASGEEGLALFRAQSPDIVLMDSMELCQEDMIINMSILIWDII